ncbi:MAG: Xaa-Pro peptidase family protein [Planctomycetes bacterium]|nr:Xaa-Pro peptidase family protein [Planctomycetota bacterium]
MTRPDTNARVRALRDRLKPHGISALLVTNPNDIRYLTGFVGHDSWALVPMAGEPVTIISDNRFEEQIGREAPRAKAVMRKGSLSEAVAKLAAKTKAKRIGLQPEHVSLQQYKALSKAVGSARLKPVTDGLIQQRAVKDAGEIADIRRALKAQQEAFRRVTRAIRPGDSEQTVAAKLEYTMRLLGADGPSFNTIIAAGANASLPHAIPGPAKVRSGGIVLIDWGAKFNGYCSDLTRVIALGRMPAKIREIYKIVLDAQLAGIAAIAPGKKLKDIDKVARDIIKKAGYGDRFGHGLGHGIGLDIHEQPSLSWRTEERLEVGQVVTVEPGIYLPGVGGVRIEDDVLVTPRGHEVLSDLPKGLESAIM